MTIVRYDTSASREKFLKMSNDVGKAAMLVPPELKTSVGYAAAMLEIMSFDLPSEKGEPSHPYGSQSPRYKSKKKSAKKNTGGTDHMMTTMRRVK